MFTRRSKKKYIWSFLKVTFKPKGIPTLVLKLEMDFFDFVTWAFCPAIAERSSSALFKILLSVPSNPRPIFKTILTNLGACILLLKDKFLHKVGTISFIYFSFNLGTNFIFYSLFLIFLLLQSFLFLPFFQLFSLLLRQII